MGLKKLHKLIDNLCRQRGNESSASIHHFLLICFCFLGRRLSSFGNRLSDFETSWQGRGEGQGEGDARSVLCHITASENKTEKKRWWRPH